VFSVEKCVELDQVEDAFVINIDDKMQFHTFEIDTACPNTIELCLEDNTIYM
jgi:hypothetical protein